MAAVLLRSSSLISAPRASFDEDTFILVAQRLARGELPFTTTFENKPPLFSVLPAIPQLFAPESRLAVRVALTVVILLTGFAVAVSVRRATGSVLGGGASGLALVGFSALAPSGQAWMSQHSANFWLAILLLLCWPRGTATRARSPFLVGVVAGVLVLTRTNYVIPATVLLLLDLAWRPAGGRFGVFARVVAGGASVAGIVAAAYGLVGELPALLAGALDVLVAEGGQGDVRSTLRPLPGWMMSTVGLFAVVSVAALPGAAGRPKPALRLWWSGVALAASIGVSVLLHRSIFSHYLLMFGVPVAILSGLVVHAVLQGIGVPGQPRLVRRGLTVITLRVALPLAAAGALAGPAGLQPTRLIPAVGTSEASEDRALVDALRGFLEQSPGSVWALSDHFVYWRTGTLPPHPLVTHPSSLTKSEFWSSVPLDASARPQTTRQAIDLILATRPRYVVSTEHLDEWYLDPFPEERAHLRERLAGDYRVVWRSDGDMAIRERLPEP